jgi:tetratricopeptide (TPR) repeat protein/SAM-dependent methyltransferase
MNRKDRRAAQRQGRGASPFAAAAGRMPAAPSASLFAAAIQYFNAGQLEQAERACRDVLTFERNHFDALHMLGIIAMRIGRLDAALPLLRQALTANERSADCHFNLAQVARALGQLDEAVAHFTQATTLKRDHVGAHVMLADTLLQQGRVDEARSRYERALVLDPRRVEAQHGLANALTRQGRLGEAVTHYRRVLALKPDFAEAHSNLGVALAALGQADEAAAEYQRALALRPDLFDVYRNLARLTLARGDAAQALAVVRRGLAVRETDELKGLFVQCMRALPAVSADDELRATLVRALTEGWGRPNELAGAAVSLVRSGPAGEAIARAAAAWPAQPSAAEFWGPQERSAIAGDLLLRALLEAAPVPDIALERFLTGARAALLDLAGAADAATAPDFESLAFFCALARQCFINEYVFSRTEDETRQWNALQARLAAALQAGGAIPTLWPVAAGAYGPLHAIKGAELLLARPWPPAVAALIDQQVREPAEERQLREAIPAVTPIDDAVSVAVQRQYEEMPYPRWIKTAPTGAPTTPDWYLRNLLPHATPAPSGRALGHHGGIDILVAGCGTGQHAIETAQRFAGARVLAIDLSRTSLGYAKRKTRAMGLANIDYAQADILRLGSLGRDFDLIESSGVLHHLGDPEAGWRVLVSLLRPGGFMHVGLYSAAARASIRAARDFIAERGYGHNADDIRRCRQELMGLPAPIGDVTKFNDFFATSECRDLLFHVQEHQFTIPRIKAFIEEAGLMFLGFSGAPAEAYRRRFPDDPAALDLDRWDALERESPLLFVNMYQFWLQQPR